MVAFLRWSRSLFLGVLNSIAKLVLVLVLIVVVILVAGLVIGDGLPGKMVLALDLRSPIADSDNSPGFILGTRSVTVMDTVLALADAEHDDRVKGVVLRVGSGGLSIAQAEELGTALRHFRKSGKFVIAQATGFFGAGLGDYLTAAAADQIWMQPESTFAASGAGGAEIFLRGLFDKIQAEPQIAKRMEYKSAADMFMAKTMSAEDHEQLTTIMQSWYQAATKAVAADRKLTPKAVAAAFEASPQFTEDAKREGLIDKIGYDDDAMAAAMGRAGKGAKPVPMAAYIKAQRSGAGYDNDAQVALIEAAGDIRDGTNKGSLFGAAPVIASDDLSQAIRQAAQDSGIKAIIVRVDSPGGSVTASDQILHAVKKAQAKGKIVVVSMGAVAASGGYYISSSANKIVAEPATLTGSIGVLTGKVSIGKSLGLIGVTASQVSIGKNTLMDSAITPYTPDQWAALNHQADVIYADFMRKVAAGRKLPLAKVQQIARGRVWSGADAQHIGLVDALGGFWTAADLARKLAGIPADAPMRFKLFPQRKSIWERVSRIFGESTASLRALQGLSTMMNTPLAQTLIRVSGDVPRGGVEMRAANLPR
jgi:protease-4